MRHIAILTDDKVPGDVEFKFRDRAKTLVDKRRVILNAEKLAGMGKQEANGDAGVDGDVSGGKDDKAEKVTEGTKNLDLNAGANGDGQSFVYCVGGRCTDNFAFF
jgi:hypothetical protein